MLEVNGRYWHSDPRFYNIIEYQAQYDRIINDKRKNKLIKSKYNIDILYLWEDDLVDNIDMCKSLILEYIEKKGILSNYHSFNYSLIDSLTLNNNLIIAYSDYSKEKLHELFVPANGKKRSHKQIDKWITFKCEYCNKEKEQLISHYQKSKTHCCSRECAQKHKIGKTRRFYKLN